MSLCVTLVAGKHHGRSVQYVSSGCGQSQGYVSKNICEIMTSTIHYADWYTCCYALVGRDRGTTSTICTFWCGGPGLLGSLTVELYKEVLVAIHMIDLLDKLIELLMQH